MSAMVAATKRTVTQFLNIDLGFRILITTFYFYADLCALFDVWGDFPESA